MSVRKPSPAKLLKALKMTKEQLVIEARKLVDNNSLPSVTETVNICRRAISYLEIVGDDDDMFDSREEGDMAQTHAQFFVCIAMGYPLVSVEVSDYFWRQLIGEKNLYLTVRKEFVTAFAKRLVEFFEKIGKHDENYLGLVESGRIEAL